MALVAGHLLDQIRHRIGGQVAADVGGGIQIINLAGRWVFGSHPWRRASRLAATVAFVADQEWCDVPTGFQALTSIENTTVMGNPVVQVGADELTKLRTQQPDYEGWPLYVTVEHFEDDDGTIGDRLAIHPAQSASDADGLKISYRAGWVDVAEAADVLKIHPLLEQLVIHAIREYAAGVEFGDLDERLGKVLMGPVMQATRHADGDAQPHLGPMRGGAVEGLVSNRDPWDWANYAVDYSIT